MRSVVVLAMWLMLAAGVAEARDPEPVARIPLAPLGYQTVPPEQLLGGSSMLTVDFVDRDHLLVTFAVHRLMKREPDERADDQDRTVAAALLELPTGKLLAQTEWRLHDHGQYLWSLGDGRFLLRVRDHLSVIAPISHAEAFRETPLLSLTRRIVAVLVSANDDLLTVESTRRVGPGVAANVTLVDPTLDDSAQSDSAPVQINFFRLSSVSPGAGGLRATPAGAIRARIALSLPMTTSGFLDLDDNRRNHWLFNFDQHTGKVDGLAGFDSTCFPRSTFVDHGEFVAFGCRGGADRQLMAGFNLKGELMWQQSFSDAHVAPIFSFAPAAGRFALGRVLVSIAMDEDGALPGSVVSAQEVRVLQSYDGQLLLKVNCSPVERAGGNFALSADGLQLAVVRERIVSHPPTTQFDAYTSRDTAVEIYALPALSVRDQAEVKAAERMSPPDVGARIDRSLERISTPIPPQDASASGAVSEFGAVSKSGAASQSGSASPTDAPSPADAPSVVGVASPLGAQRSPSVVEQGSPIPTTKPVEASTTALGDPLPDAPRPRPTLYDSDEKSPSEN